MPTPSRSSWRPAAARSSTSGTFGRPDILTQTGGTVDSPSDPAGRVEDGHQQRRRQDARQLARDADHAPHARAGRRRLRAASPRRGRWRRADRQASSTTTPTERSSPRTTQRRRRRRRHVRRRGAVDQGGRHRSSAGRRRIRTPRASAACVTRSRPTARGSSRSTATTTTSARNTCSRPSARPRQPMATSAAGSAAITPDGSFALNASGQLINLTTGGTRVPANGLTAVGTNLGTPAFAPDGSTWCSTRWPAPASATPRRSSSSWASISSTGTFASPVTVADFTGSASRRATGLGGLPTRQLGGGVPTSDRRTASTEPQRRPAHAQGRQGLLGVAPSQRQRAAVPLDQLNGKNGNDGLPAEARSAHQPGLHRRRPPGRQHRPRPWRRR